MPLYDYECEGCKQVIEQFERYEDRVVPSDCCPGYSLHRIVSIPKLDLFKPDHYEELGDDIPYIESKQQLAKVCQERGLVSRQLEDSYNQRYKPARWV